MVDGAIRGGQPQQEVNGVGVPVAAASHRVAELYAVAEPARCWGRCAESSGSDVDVGELAHRRRSVPSYW